MRDREGDAAMTSSECLSPGELARMLDGRASSRERRTWMTHLDGCVDCRIVQAEAASYLEDASLLDRDRPLVTAFWNRFRMPLWAVAASLLAAVLVPVVLLTDPSGWLGPNGPAVSEITAGSATAALPTADVALSEHRWKPSERGLGFDSGLTETERAFRAGVYLVDLNVAAREGRRTDVASILEEVELLIGESDALSAARRDVDTSALESLARDATDDTFFALGVWSEASRLAAVAGNASYFESEPFTMGLATFLGLELPEPLPARLDSIRSLTDGGVSEAELSGLRRELRNVILLN